MADSARLLQMLEPAVRPVSAPGAPRKSTTAPFEQRGFDDLLAEFRQNPTPGGTPVAEETTDPTETPAPTARNPLADALTDLGRIENASLRELIAQRPQPVAQQPTADRPAA